MRSLRFDKISSTEHRIVSTSPSLRDPAWCPEHGTLGPCTRHRRVPPSRSVPNPCLAQGPTQAVSNDSRHQCSIYSRCCKFNDANAYEYLRGTGWCTAPTSLKREKQHSHSPRARPYHLAWSATRKPPFDRGRPPLRQARLHVQSRCPLTKLDW